jgi:hypothetical protein
VGRFRSIVEQLRDAVDDQGAKGCFKQSVKVYSKLTGIDTDGLWAAVDGVLQGYDAEKLLKRLQKSWGGTPEQWVRWFKIAKTKPDCADLEPTI